MTTTDGHTGSPTASATETATNTPTDTPTDTASASPTRTPVAIDASDLSFSVSAERQPTEEAPGRVRASLTNETDATLELSGGDPLPVGYDTYFAEQVDAAAPLVLFPDQEDAGNDYFWVDGTEPVVSANVDDAVYDGCWRVPAELGRSQAGMIKRVASEGTVAADYYPLGFIDADCPTGTYRARGDMHVRSRVGWNQFVRTTMTVEIDVDGAIAADGSMSLSEPT